MRFYDIVITDQDDDSLVYVDYTSYKNGQTLRGALNVEFDIPVAPFAAPAGTAFVRIWGISLQDISQASNLVGKHVAVYGGMKKGLPLANPAQSGLLVRGQIFQALGNWIGLDMTLDLYIIAGTSGTGVAPSQTEGTASIDDKNIVHNWPKNTALEDAIRTTLTTAFPGYTVNIDINPNLVLQEDDIGFYQNLVQYAQYLKRMSIDIISPNAIAPSAGSYLGVDIALDGTTFTVSDRFAQGQAKNVSFLDLIGQPTWIDAPLIQFKTVMRADLKLLDYIRLPASLVTTTPQSFSQYRDKTTFQGIFQVRQIRHVGNFRQSDAASWVTVFDAFPTASPSAASG